jgi:hypothetical protein
VLNTESEYYLHSNLNRRKWEKPTPTWTKKRFQKTIPTERFAIALPHPQQANCLQQRFAIALHIPKKRSHSDIPKSDRPPTSSKSELLAAALRYRPPTFPKSELLAAALRYRPPTFPKKRSHSHISKAIAPPTSKTAIAPPHPKKRTACSSASLSPSHTPQKANCLQQRFAIALPHPQKANCLQQRFAIALSHPQNRSPSHIPKSDRTSHIPKSDSYGALRYRTPTPPKSELLAAALRYRPLTSPKAIALPHPQNSELLAAALRYRSPTPQKAISLPHPKK